MRARGAKFWFSGVATIVVFAGAFAVWRCHAIVMKAAQDREYASVRSIPARPFAIVFGAGLNPDGTPSGMLADRLNGGALLLAAGKVRSLLFTGDNDTVEHNELASMLTYALAHHVPRDRIRLDYAGFDTYDSCYRAIRLFHVRAATLVTQAFHLLRALYLCRSMGIDVVGLVEPDWGKYQRSMMMDLTLREIAAQVRAVYDVHEHRIPELPR